MDNEQRSIRNSPQPHFLIYLAVPFVVFFIILAIGHKITGSICGGGFNGFSCSLDSLFYVVLPLALTTSGFITILARRLSGEWKPIYIVLFCATILVLVLVLIVISISRLIV